MGINMFSIVLLTVTTVLGACGGTDADACAASGTHCVYTENIGCRFYCPIVPNQVDCENDPNTNCRWNATQNKCFFKCEKVGDKECAENDCVFYEGANCKDKDYAISCGEIKVRSQCILKKDDNGCFWRPKGRNFKERDVEGDCMGTTSCSVALDSKQCATLRNDYHKSCFFNGTDCLEANCDAFESLVDCTKHGVPNLHCSWNNETDDCGTAPTRTCENSGANDHASCFAAKKNTGLNCFWRYDEGENGECRVHNEALTCRELNLEECLSLSYDYIGIYCKGLDNECKSVTKCSQIGNELDCISNSSETNQCFYASSLQSDGKPGNCYLREAVTCDKLLTATKCYFHGIEGLFCEWNPATNTCGNSKSCESKSKPECVADPNCYFAVDADSYFNPNTYNLPKDPAKGSCHTLDSFAPGDVVGERSQHRNKCKYLVNPTQCNSESHNETIPASDTLPDARDDIVQDCLYAICSNSQDPDCEGNCVPWSMHHRADDPDSSFVEMDAAKEDCTRIVDQSQCVEYLRSEGEFRDKSFCLWGIEHCYATEFDDQKHVIYEAPCNEKKDAEVCSNEGTCIWIDEVCKLRSTSSCETVTYLDDDDACNLLVFDQTSDVTGAESYGCHKYESYFEPGIQEVVSYRCKEYIDSCEQIGDSKKCNDAGSGDGQTCFWLETYDADTNTPGGSCVSPQNPPLECSNFTASQCPVTDTQLIPFVGAQIVCQVTKDGLGCENSSFLSLPNYCAQYRYRLDDPNIDDPRAPCTSTGVCSPVDVIPEQEGVCVPDQANTPTCPIFLESELCHYIDYTEGSTHVGINCEWLTLRGKAAGCVDASFVQCEDVTVDECITGLRGKEDKCLVDAQECKINRCSSATNKENCSPTLQNRGCEWSDADNACIKKTCGSYDLSECPSHCETNGVACSTYPTCASVLDKDKCPNALPSSKVRCYWDELNVGCFDVVSTLCNESQIKNECENMKPNDGYGCEYKDTAEGSKCVLSETVSCQGIVPLTPEECHPAEVSKSEPTQRLFAHFGEWCDYNGNTQSCQPKCAAIENGDDCVRESRYCDLFYGTKCKSRVFVNGNSANCASAGVLECVFYCRWVDNVTGCEAIPDVPNPDQAKVNTAVIIGSIIGGIVILLLIAGIVIVILLYMRMKKKHAEEEERLRREAEEAENNEEDDGGSSGAYGKNVNMDANPDAAASGDGSGGW